jgi:hypothetical protein
MVGTRKSHLQKLGHHKHKGNDATDNVSVVVHSANFAKVYTNQNESFGPFYELSIQFGLMLDA